MTFATAGYREGGIYSLVKGCQWLQGTKFEKSQLAIFVRVVASVGTCPRAQEASKVGREVLPTVTAQITRKAWLDKPLVPYVQVGTSFFTATQCPLYLQAAYHTEPARGASTSTPSLSAPIMRLNLG